MEVEARNRTMIDIPRKIVPQKHQVMMFGKVVIAALLILFLVSTALLSEQLFTLIYLDKSHIDRNKEN